MVALAALVSELKTLRKGRGIFTSHVADRVGAGLREVCQVAEDDGPAVIRQKLIRRLDELARDLPEDLRVAVLAAFAILPDARQPLYQDRVGWTAVRLGRDPRTARRRIDDGIHQLAQLATAPEASKPAPSGARATGWHTSELRVALVLDRSRPEAFELRRIVADQDDVAALDLAVTLVPPGEPADAGPEVERDLIYGGTLVDRGMESSDRYGYALVLPRPLARGETHEFAMQFTLAEGHLMRPYFACVPRHPCDIFVLRVRFGPRRPPARVSLLRHVFQRDVYDLTLEGEPVPVDPAGEVHLVFRDLKPGLAYGVRWA